MCRKPITAATAAPASISARRRAFPAPYRLDARRCISYLTIEHKGPIPRELRPPSATASMAATIAWRYAPGTSSRRSAARRSWRHAKGCGRLALADLARLDDAAFRKLFAKSPVKRTGRNRFLRNVLIAIGNSADATLAPEAERLLGDASALVRGAAIWALGRLLPRERLDQIAAGARAQETEALVEAEWASALANHTLCHSGRGTPDLSGDREPEASKQRARLLNDRATSVMNGGARCPPFTRA